MKITIVCAGKIKEKYLTAGIAEFMKRLKPFAQVEIREIHEECGIVVKPTDKVTVLNPCAFSTPGMTDESNAFLCAEITLGDTTGLSQTGAVGSELFAGYELADIEDAERFFTTGRDRYGNYFSLATWAVLGYFLREYR